MASSNLSFGAVSFLTLQAVLEVVIVCFAGFVAARTGALTSLGQKVLLRLNVDLFTPCLVFSKLALLLSIGKLADLAVVPVFFGVSTLTAYFFSRLTARALALDGAEADYVTAMAVFGNSNSLPVSLTLSLAATLPDLLWDQIEGDSSDKVALRGLLYLLLFQQLGQVLRWLWGYNKLLRPAGETEPLIKRGGGGGGGVLGFMNPPLYAMALSVVVASTPLRQWFFLDTFLLRTVTRSVEQMGNVLVPLILIVLGSNLCPTNDVPQAKRHTRIVVAALVSRMILPAMVLLPVIALCVKCVPVSVLDDPIFLVVAFILTTLPPAIQLLQITQLNNVFQAEMAKVLFWGYAVLTLPTTIFVVAASLETLEWVLQTS